LKPHDPNLIGFMFVNVFHLSKESRLAYVPLDFLSPGILDPSACPFNFNMTVGVHRIDTDS
jgi:hypothetical protein